MNVRNSAARRLYLSTAVRFWVNNISKPATAANINPCQREWTRVQQIAFIKLAGSHGFMNSSCIVGDLHLVQYILNCLKLLFRSFLIAQ